MIKPYYIAEWVVFICSFFLISAKTERYLIWFIPYCFLIVLTETLATMLNVPRIGNHHIYNIFMFFDVVFVYWLYTKAFTEKKLVTAVKITGTIGIIFYFINILFIQKSRYLNTYTLLYEFITMSAISFTYLFFLMQKTERNVFYRQPMFWVSAGMFLYYLPSSIIFAFFTIFSAGSKELSNIFKEIFDFTSNVANLICYLLFSIGFIYKFLQRKSYYQSL